MGHLLYLAALPSANLEPSTGREPPFVDPLVGLPFSLPTGKFQPSGNATQKTVSAFTYFFMIAVASWRPWVLFATRE